MAKKRRHFEGSITKHSKRDLYMARLMVNGIRKTVYGKTSEEVIDKLDQLKKDKRQGLGLISRDMRLQELADMWLESKRAGWQPKTIEAYWTPMKLHLLPLLAKKKLSMLNNPAFLDDFFNKTLIKAGKTPNTVHRSYKTLHACFEWAIGRNIIAFNKCVGGKQGYFKLPIHESRGLPLLQVDDVKGLSAVISKQSKSVLWTISLATGMRINEVLGLSDEDIDFERNTITVRHQLKREQGVVYLDKTKSRKVRVIPVDETIINKLIVHLGLNEQLQQRLAEDSIKWTPDVTCTCCSNSSFRMLFLNNVGNPLDYDNLVSRDWARLMKEWDSGITLKIHDLRHIFASINLTNGVDVVTVSKLMGHANPSITLKIYAQYINPPNQDKVATYMANIIGSTDA